MPDPTVALPDSTAVRTALWRALHLEVDGAPPVFSDPLGLKLAVPDANWRERPDMNPEFTKQFRASIVARARFVEDLLAREIGAGVSQYLLLGAGLDTFAQRRPDLAGNLQIFEIDQPGPQRWKQERLAALGLLVPASQHFVPVNFEAGDDWWGRLTAAGFDAKRPTLVASTGVAMYLTRAANLATLRQLAGLPRGSTLAMTFMLPLEMAEPAARVGMEAAARGAKASGTPFVSYFSPDDALALGREAGFREVEHVSAVELTRRYFAGRADGLRPPANGEEFLIART